MLGAIIKKQINELVEANKKYRYVQASMGLYFLWIGVMFQTPEYRASGSLVSYLTSPWLLFSLFYGAVYFFIGVFYKKIAPFFLRKESIYAVCAVLLIGTVLDFIVCPSLASGVLYDVVYYSGMVLISIGTASIMLVGGSANAYIGARNTLLVCGTGMVFAMAAMVVIGILEEIGRTAALMLIPLLMAFTNQRIFKTLPRKQVLCRGLKHDPLKPTKILATSFFHGIAYSFLLIVLSLQPHMGSYLVFTGIFFLIGAVLVIGVTLFLNADYNKLLYQCAFPLIAIGMVFIAAFSEQQYIGCAFLAVGYYVLLTLMTGVCAYIANQFDLSAFWVLSLLTCCFMSGQIIGVLGIEIALSANVTMPVIACVLIFVLLMQSIFFSSNRNMRYGWGVVTPNTTETTMTPQEFAVQRLAADMKLTNREAEIAFALAQEKTRKQIAKELVLSEETVKTHVSHVYTKVGVHSKEELMGVIEKLVSDPE